MTDYFGIARKGVGSQRFKNKLSTESSLNLSGASLGKSSGDGGDLLGDEY